MPVSKLVSVRPFSGRGRGGTSLRNLRRDGALHGMRVTHVAIPFMIYANTSPPVIAPATDVGDEADGTAIWPGLANFTQDELAAPGNVVFEKATSVANTEMELLIEGIDHMDRLTSEVVTLAATHVVAATLTCWKRIELVTLVSSGSAVTGVYNLSLNLRGSTPATEHSYWGETVPTNGPLARIGLPFMIDKPRDVQAIFVSTDTSGLVLGSGAFQDDGSELGQFEYSVTAASQFDLYSAENMVSVERNTVAVPAINISTAGPVYVTICMDPNVADVTF